MAKEIPGQKSLWQSETYQENSLEKNRRIHIHDFILYGSSLYQRVSVVKEKSGGPTPTTGFFITSREKKINGYFIIGIYEFDNEKIEGTTKVIPIKRLFSQSCISADWHQDERIKKVIEKYDIKSYFVAEFVREDNPIEPPAIIQDGNSILSINMETIQRPPIVPFPHFNNPKK